MSLKDWMAIEKHPKMFCCYDFVNVVINKEKNILLVTKPYLFTIGTKYKD